MSLINPAEMMEIVQLVNNSRSGMRATHTRRSTPQIVLTTRNMSIKIDDVWYAVIEEVHGLKKKEDSQQFLMIEAMGSRRGLSQWSVTMPDDVIQPLSARGRII